MVAGLSRILFHPIRFRFAFKLYVLEFRISTGTVFRFCPAIICHISRCQSTNHNSVSRHPAIVQNSDAGIHDCFKVLLIQCLFMVAKRKVCWRDSGTPFQKGEDIRLRDKRRNIVRWPDTINDISSNTNDIRFIPLQGKDSFLIRPSMQVGE